jgi:hypothetical protein
LRGRCRMLVYEPRAVVGHDHRESLRTLPAKVWSYGVHSPVVGPVRSVRHAVLGFIRMHRRPNDQIRKALSEDVRHGRVIMVALDLFLLASSLFLFLTRARHLLDRH